MTPDAIKKQRSNVSNQPHPFPPRGNVGSISKSLISNTRSAKKGLIRYKDPTLSRCASQIVVHGFFGALFYQFALDQMIKEICHYNPTGHWDNPAYLTQKTFVMCCCILMSCFLLLATYFSRSYHELSPKMFELSRNASALDLTQKVFQILVLQIQSSGLLFYFICLPIVSLIISGPFQQSNAAMLPTMMLYTKALLIAYTATLFLAIYVMIMDILVRIALLQPGLNVISLFSEGIEKANVVRSENCRSSIAIDDDISGSVAVDDVIVEILLGGLGPHVINFVTSPRVVINQDGTILTNVRTSRSTANIHIDLEEEEYRRNKAVISGIVDLIETGLVAGHLSFEDDFLRFCVLEALGGPNQSQDCGFPLGLSWRHYKFLYRCLEGDEATKGKNIQSAGVSILRSICVYIGAIGEALSHPASSSKYSLSPCLMISLQYAVHAAARLVVLNMTFEHGRTETKVKRLNRMTLLLATVVESMYCIRRGMLSYGHQLYESNYTLDSIDNVSISFQYHGARVYRAAESFESFLAVKHSAIASVVNACDECASMIVRELNCVDGSPDFDLKVHSQCREWFQSVIQ